MRSVGPILREAGRRGHTRTRTHAISHQAGECVPQPQVSRTDGGLPWLSSRKTGMLYGMADDAERVAGDIVELAASGA